ncbi:hypothetical protein Nepgr_033715 [Nepenthes gracilis]|uniref:Uncharacterized protein n=1 Tax=Nepenthes gracilis TaxID=150966 RepID=A0AAD3TME0_NEPGR|nr:hypothetical protein Nepgr_033715 [Nepenthes gracilis]
MREDVHLVGLILSTSSAGHICLWLSIRSFLQYAAISKLMALANFAAHEVGCGVIGRFWNAEDELVAILRHANDGVLISRG